jgi:hypothetical protein
MQKIDTGYRPWPKQQMLHACEANEILYGGAAGPGKSHALRHEAFDWCLRIPGLQVYLFRRTFPELEKNHIIPSLAEFPRQIGNYKEQKRRWEFRNGSMLHFCHAQHEHDVFAYQGAEIHLLVIDELTSFTEFMYDYLRGRVRCSVEIEPRYRHKIPGIVCGSNPGGVGHEFCKRRWVDFGKAFECKKASDNEGGMVRSYIPGLLDDNPSLTKNDPGYIHRLDALPEPYRTAYKTGDWNIFMGQAFNFNRVHHVIPPMPIPDHAPIYMTMDWGYGAPFSIGWWWVDGDGRIYRFAEWYGWNGTPNQGLRLSDSEIAQRITEREKEMDLPAPVLFRYSGPDCFNKKPNYQGGGQGPSTAEVFADYGLILIAGDANRPLKIRQFRERLKVVLDDQGEMKELPMLVVYATCDQFIRTVPLIQTDPKNVEYVDENCELHCFDDACHICMARPIALPGAPKRKLTMFEKDMLHITGVDPRDAENGGSSRPTRAQVWVDDAEQDYERDEQLQYWT